jgi:hypothetical protein
MFSRVPTTESRWLVDRRDLGDRDNVFPYEYNIATTFPLSGKTFLQILARHTSATSQAENFTR